MCAQQQHRIEQLERQGIDEKDINEINKSFDLQSMMRTDRFHKYKRTIGDEKKKQKIEDNKLKRNLELKKILDEREWHESNEKLKS